ncbi:MAG: hypothetical protein ABFD82_18295 [Syntrophaceae bacterium]
MKAYLFIETGEVRAHENGEWGMDGAGWISSGHKQNICNGTILTRHEIEINPRANEIHVTQHRGEMELKKEISRRIFDIPRPKVKKWQWLCKERATGKYYMTDPITQKDFDDWDKCMVEIIYRIDETEIEVEE